MRIQYPLCAFSRNSSLAALGPKKTKLFHGRDFKLYSKYKYTVVFLFSIFDFLFFKSYIDLFGTASRYSVPTSIFHWYYNYDFVYLGSE